MAFASVSPMERGAHLLRWFAHLSQVFLLLCTGLALLWLGSGFALCARLYTFPMLFHHFREEGISHAAWRSPWHLLPPLLSSSPRPNLCYLRKQKDSWRWRKRERGERREGRRKKGLREVEEKGTTEPPLTPIRICGVYHKTLIRVL